MTEEQKKQASESIIAMGNEAPLLPKEQLEFLYELFKAGFYILRDELDRRSELEN